VVLIWEGRESGGWGPSRVQLVQEKSPQGRDDLGRVHENKHRLDGEGTTEIDEGRAEKYFGKWFELPFDIRTALRKGLDLGGVLEGAFCNKGGARGHGGSPPPKRCQLLREGKKRSLVGGSCGVSGERKAPGHLRY